MIILWFICLLHIITGFDLELNLKRDELDDRQLEVILAAEKGDSDALFTIASALDSGNSILGNYNPSKAARLYHYALKSDENHILSMKNLGSLYSQAIGVPRNTIYAFNLFQQAAYMGDHASHYNAGLLLFEGIKSEYLQEVDDGADINHYITSDIVGALGYMQAAFKYSKSYPKHADPSITTAALQAHELICATVSRANHLSLKEIADVWLFGIIDDNERETTTLWTSAIVSLVNFNDSFVNSHGRNVVGFDVDIDSLNHNNDLIHAYTNLTQLIDTYSHDMSDLQLYLALKNLNNMMGPLVGKDDSYVSKAGKYAEMLALTNLCRSHYATQESDPACFNDAISRAISYYRRIGDYDGAMRIFNHGSKHKDASTHWRSVLQTPRVYDTNKDIRAMPYWIASEFGAARSLRGLYEDPNSWKKVQKELQDVIKLKEGKLSGSTHSGSESLLSSESKNVNAKLTESDGMRRIATRYIGVHSTYNKNTVAGAGAWAEFGPLYVIDDDDNDENDGTVGRWTDRCKLVPTICDALKRSEAMSSLCTTKKCGTKTIITILRLRPGVSIFPHCGTTNRRLIMHFPLSGAEGVRLVVGEQEVLSYRGVFSDQGGDGSPIVFDDSFEHHVHHEGTQERFVVLAVLQHPNIR